METLRFKNDGPKRKKLWVGEAMSHPAKGHIAMWEEMILRYSQEGDTILDPLAGIGTTLIAALMGRDVIVNELEHHFLLPMVRSWAKMRQSPMLGFQTGDVQFLWGDARNLRDARLWPYQELAVRFSKAPDLPALKTIRRKYRLPLYQSYDGPPVLMSEVRNNEGKWYSRTYRFSEVRLPTALDVDNDDAAHSGISASGAVDAVITSPPWEDKTALQDSQWLHSHEAELAERFRQAHVGEKGLPGNTKPEHRSTMESYTRPVDAIVTSPPYETSIKDTPEHNSIDYTKSKRDGDTSHWASRVKGASGNPTMSYGQARRPVDAIVTSPPFQAEASIPTSPNRLAEIKYVGIPYKDERANHEEMRNLITGRYERANYVNIGNLRGQAYWTAQALVYAECWRVLKPGGILALVLKGFTRDGKYVDLPGQTEAMLLEAGWLPHDHWRRELWSLSFWRTLQKRRDPAAWDDRLMYEEVLCFKRPC